MTLNTNIKFHLSESHRVTFKESLFSKTSFQTISDDWAQHVIFLRARDPCVLSSCAWHYGESTLKYN